MEKLYVFFHVLGAILFLGNVITTAFWKLQADRSRDPKERHRAALAVMKADFVLTIPGLVLIVVFGVLTAHAYGYSMAEISWLTISIGLFALAGLLWGAVLLPSQLAMIRHSKAGIPSGELPLAYDKASARWNLWGSINTIIPLVVLFLMVVKP